MNTKVRVVIPVTLVVVGVGGYLAWRHFTQVNPISVPVAVQRFRAAQPPPYDDTAPGPLVGVYRYRTTGSEHISTGITHHYPGTTALTVTRTSCGVRLRWDALSQRWMQWQLCRSPSGWRLAGYTDYHQFLTVNDRIDYTCTGPNLPNLPQIARRARTLTCTSPTSHMTIAMTALPARTITVGRSAVPAVGVHLAMHGTGVSLATDTADLWLGSTGLPLRASVVSHGSQHRLGVDVQYDETATYQLASTAPLR